jgi:acetone carboxylase gamma subunit
VSQCVAGHWHKNAVKGWKIRASLAVRSSAQVLRSSALAFKPKRYD